MADILLINSPVRNAFKDGHAGLSPPLGIAYIAAVLLEKGYHVAALDLNLNGMNPARVRRIMQEEDPKIIGISAYTATYENGLKIARISKDLNPNTTVIMGGPHATIMSEQVAQEKNVDIVVRGEGEQTTLELTDHLLNGCGNLDEVKGISFKRNGQIHSTPERPFLENPDILPFPARDIFPLYLYDYPGNMLMSRGGCPFTCSFCAVNNIWHGARRYRSPQQVVEEILFIFREYQVNEINFADDTFTLNRRRVLELCQEIRKAQIPILWRWTCATRPDLVDKELLIEMNRAGCTGIQLGVEAGSQKILDSIGKQITLEQVRDAVRMCKEVGINAFCSFMFPHPEDTVETVREQISFMKELAEMGAMTTMSFTIPYPGTLLFDSAKELGIQVLANSWEDYDSKNLTIATKHLQKEQLDQLFLEIVREVGLGPYRTDRGVRLEAI